MGRGVTRELPQPTLSSNGGAGAAAETDRRERVFFGGEPVSTPVYERDALRPGHVIAGPAVVVQGRLERPGFS